MMSRPIVLAAAFVVGAIACQDPPPPPRIAADGGAGARPPAGAVEVQYIANEGVLLTAGEDRVLIDGLHREYRASYPFLPEPHSTALETAQPPFDGIDLVLVSHHHLDHFHAEAVGRYLLNSTQTLLLSSAQVVGDIERTFAGFSRIRSRVTAVTPPVGTRTMTKAGGIELVVLGVGHGTGRNKEVQNLGHIVILNGRTFLHLGDAATDDRSIFERLRLADARIDVAFLPIWFLTDEDGQAIVRDLIRPARIVAVHMPAAAPERSAAQARRAFPGADFFTTLLERVTY